MTNNMRQVTITLINKTEDLIPAFEPETPTFRRRVSKAAIGILRDFLHWLAGVSTESDIQEIRHMLDKIKKGTELATAEMTRTKQGFLTASTLMNDRLQRMNSILDEEVRQTGIIYREVAALHTTAGVEIYSIAFIANEIAKFIQVYSDLFHLELAIDSLSHGNLSPSLIDIHHV
jgi:hypothetical protein